MADILMMLSMFILLTVAVGLIRVLRGPTAIDRMMSVQLLGTGGIASLLIWGTLSGDNAIIDVALTLALLAAFVTSAFVVWTTRVLQEKGAP